MHAETATAVRELVASLLKHPEDLATLKAYGDLPTHLTDLIEDYADDLENEEVTK